jgi:hypothetical protein
MKMQNRNISFKSMPFEKLKKGNVIYFEDGSFCLILDKCSLRENNCITFIVVGSKTIMESVPFVKEGDYLVLK